MKLPVTALYTAIRRFYYKCVSLRAFSRKWQFRNVSQKRLSFQQAPYVTQWTKPNRLLTSQNIQGRVVCLQYVASQDLHVLAAKMEDRQTWKIQCYLRLGKQTLKRPEFSSKDTSTCGVPAMAVAALAISAPKLWSPVFTLLSMSGNSDRKPGVKKQLEMQIFKFSDSK